MSAFGFLTAPLAFEFVRSRRCRLDEADWDAVNAFLAEMEAQGVALLGEAGLAPDTSAMFAPSRE